MTTRLEPPPKWLLCSSCGKSWPNKNQWARGATLAPCPLVAGHGTLTATDDAPNRIESHGGKFSPVIDIIDGWLQWWNVPPDKRPPGWPDPTVWRLAKDLIPPLRDTVVPYLQDLGLQVGWYWMDPRSLGPHLNGLSKLLIIRFGLEIKYASVEYPADLRKMYRFVGRSPEDVEKYMALYYPGGLE